MWWVWSPQADCRQNLNNKTYNLQKSFFFVYENITNSSVLCYSITHFSASVFNATSFSICHIPFRTTRHHRLHSEGARGNPSINHLYFLHHEKVEAPQTVAEAPSPPIPFLSAPQYENHANHENLRNPIDNHKNHENHTKSVR